MSHPGKTPIDKIALLRESWLSDLPDNIVAPEELGHLPGKSSLFKEST